MRQVQAPSLAGALTPEANVGVMCAIMLLSFASNYTGAQMQGVMSYFIIAMVMLLVARGWQIMVVIMMVVVLVVTGGGGEEEEYDDECHDCCCLLCYLNLCLLLFDFCCCHSPFVYRVSPDICRFFCLSSS